MYQSIQKEIAKAELPYILSAKPKGRLLVLNLLINVIKLNKELHLEE